jgi:hypothetical protein
MGFFAYPYTLFSLSFEAVGLYVSDLMKRLITDPRYKRGPDANCHHYHVEVYVSWYVPLFFAGDITSSVNGTRLYALR